MNQLPSLLSRYKRLGVLSAVLTLKNSHDPNASTSSSNGSGGSSLTGAGCGEDVLEVVRACTAHCPPASALFMDELASTILRDGINPRLEVTGLMLLLMGMLLGARRILNLVH